MGGAISKGVKMASKCTKCCSKQSSRQVKQLIIKNSSHNKTHNEAADDEINTENEGDCFSSWWDSHCCKCCACFKRGFVAEKSHKLETEYFIQHTQDLTFLSDMRIQPTDVLRVKNKGRALPSIVPESMKMGLTI